MTSPELEVPEVPAEPIDDNPESLAGEEVDDADLLDDETDTDDGPEV